MGQKGCQKILKSFKSASKGKFAQEPFLDLVYELFGIVWTLGGFRFNSTTYCPISLEQEGRLFVKDAVNDLSDLIRKAATFTKPPAALTTTPESSGGACNLYTAHS
eukprot:6451043-Amphidinium_carterae.1